MKAYGYSLYVVNYLSLVIGLNTIMAKEQKVATHTACVPWGG